jgi:hypothetical protein
MLRDVMHLHFLFAIAGLHFGALCAAAGEPRLVLTYQPLDGQGSGEVEICPVTCHDKHGDSGFPNEISLIAAKNIPPSNSNTELDDHNIANRAGIKISLDEDGAGKFLVQLDLTGMTVDENFICTEKEIVGATLECMRRAVGAKLDRMKIEVKTKPAGQEELKKLVVSFIKHPKKKPFRWKAEEAPK